MRDLLVVVTVVVFFALAALFVTACERLAGSGAEEQGR